MRLVWLASYPKSGNTWLRLLLSQYLFGELDELATLEQRIPDLHKIGMLPRETMARGGRSIVKTHFKWTDRHPHAAETDRFVYILRDPRDVLLSALHYARLTGGQEVDAPSFLRDCIERGGAELWERQGFGTWAAHAESWLGEGSPADRGTPHLVLRYEQVRTDPAGAIRAMVELFGTPWDEARARRAADLSQLDRAAGLEVRAKASGRSPLPGSAELAERGVRFFNKGRSGQALDEIESGLDAMLQERWAEALDRWGYSRS